MHNSCRRYLDDDNGFDSSAAGIYYVIEKSAPIRIGPYKARKTIKTVKEGDTLSIVGSVVNSYGHLWLKTFDGYYIYTENVKCEETIDYYTVILDDGALCSQKRVINGQAYGELKTPSKEGYSFEGWYTEISDGEQITEATIVDLTSDQILYAHWVENTPKSFTVSMNDGDGCYMITVTNGRPYGKLGTVSKSGFTFCGWFTDPVDGEEITESTIVDLDDNQTLYAHWEAVAIPHYSKWKKTTSQWANSPLGSTTIKESGGLVVSLSIAMVDAGIADAEQLTPNILAQKLSAVGGITANGELIWNKISYAVPGFEERTNINMKNSSLTASQKVTLIQEKINEGYKVIVQIPHPTGLHYVVADHVENGVVYMYDPSSNNTDLFATYGNYPNVAIPYDYPGRIVKEQPKPLYSYIQQQDEDGCYIAVAAMLISNYRVSNGQTGVSYYDVKRDNGNSTFFNWDTVRKYGLDDVDLFVTSTSYISAESKVEKALSAMSSNPYGVFLGLAYGQKTHAVAIIGYENGDLIVNDPARTSGGGVGVKLKDSWLAVNYGLSTQEEVLNCARFMTVFEP